MNKLYLLSISFFLLFQFAEGQNAGRGFLTGIISDEKGNKLAGASVYIHDLRLIYVSDSAGFFKTSPVNQGNYLVEVTYLGYAAIISNVEIKGSTEKNFILSSTAVEQEAVTVTGVSAATRLKQSSQAITLVKKSELLQNSSSGLMATLSRKGGVSVLSTGPAISKPVIRGLGYNRIVTINDGIRQEGQQWGDEHGIEIDEQSVKKVEILKGPSSLMYGSDALAGVINILSNQPIARGSIKANLFSGYSSNNQLYSQYADFAGHLNNGFNWNMYGAIKSAADYQNKYDGRVLNSRFKENNFGGYIGINRHWGYSHLLISSFNQKMGVPEGLRDSATGKFIIFGETPLAAIASPEQLNARDLVTPYQQVNHFKMSSDNSFSLGLHRLVVTVGYQRNQRREFADPELSKVPELYFDLSTINYNLQFHLRQLNGWKTIIGVNGMQQTNRNKADEKLIPEYSLFDAGIFGITSKSINKWVFSGGLRADLRKLSVNELSEDGELKFSPLNKNFGNVTGSLGAVLQASKKVIVKANVAKGYRAPNVAELSSNGAHEGTYRYEFGNNNLQVENGYQADAGLEINTDHVSFGLNAFYNYIHNFIFYNRLQAVGGGDSLINEDGTDLQAFKFNQANASLKGLEATLDIHPHPLDWLHIENSFSVVYGSFVQAIEGDKHLPAMPPARILTEVRGDFPKVGKVIKNLYAKAEAEIYFSQNRVFSAYNTETSTPGYTLFNAGVGFDLGYKKTICSVYLLATNLGNQAFQNHLSRLKYTDYNYSSGRQGIFNQGSNFTVKINIPLSF